MHVEYGQVLIHRARVSASKPENKLARRCGAKRRDPRGTISLQYGSYMFLNRASPSDIAACHYIEQLFIAIDEVVGSGLDFEVLIRLSIFRLFYRARFAG